MSQLILNIFSYCSGKKSSSSEVAEPLPPSGPNEWDEDGERKQVRDELQRITSALNLKDATEEERGEVEWHIQAVTESLEDYIYMMPGAELVELKQVIARVKKQIKAREEERILRLKIEAAEKRRAEQRACIDETHRLLNELPPMPAESVVLPLDQMAVVEEDVAQAKLAVSTVESAFDTEPDNFDPLNRAANRALKTAADSINKLPAIIRVEVDRRKVDLEKQAREAEELQAGLVEGWDAFGKEPKHIKKLRSAIRKCEQTLSALAQLLTTDEPSEFDACLATVTSANKGLKQRIDITNSILIAAKLEGEKAERVRQTRELRWAQALSDEQFNILSDPAVFANVVKLRKIHRRKFADLERLVESDASDFDEARLSAEAAYIELDSAYGGAAETYEREIASRTRDFATQNERVAAASEGPDPIPGTEEETEFKDAANSCEAAIRVVRKGIPNLPSAAFSSALEHCTGAVDLLLAVRERAVAGTKRRLELVDELKTQLSAAAQRKRTSLPKRPSTEISAVVERGFEAQVAQFLSRIDGKVPSADNGVVEECDKWLVQVGRVSEILTAISKDEFDLVAANVTIREDVKRLLDSIAAIGIGTTTVTEAGSLSKRVKSVAGKYEQIASLIVSRGEIKENDYYKTPWNREIDRVLELDRDKDVTNTGDLTIGIRELTTTFDDVEKRMRKAELRDVRNAAYAASAEGQFISYWDSNGVGKAVTELTRLADAGTATYGEIKRCYLSNFDDVFLEEFSVEVSVNIDGKRGIVVHAHCESDGTPKSGHACHFKLANNKREGGNSGTLNTKLRTALLPSATEVFRVVSAKWEGRKPSYI